MHKTHTQSPFSNCCYLSVKQRKLPVPKQRLNVLYRFTDKKINKIKIKTTTAKKANKKLCALHAIKGNTFSVEAWGFEI